MNQNNNKLSHKVNNRLLPAFLFSCFIAFSCTQQPVPVAMKITSKETLVKQFYAANHNYQFWLSSKKNSASANEWISAIEASKMDVTDSYKHQLNQIRLSLANIKNAASSSKDETDQQITGLVLHFLKDLQQGNIKFDYDEISIGHDSINIKQLLNSRNRESVPKIISRLECKDAEYLILKKYLSDSLTVSDTLKTKKILRAMNYRRYFSANSQPEYIVVNIPEAELKYYQNNKLKFKMRTVAGRKRTPTPTIASYITTITTFPSWNVPRTIAVAEILPKVKNNENYLEQNNFEVVDSKGNGIEDSELNWKSYTEKNFPYYFRQATGADNSLGVVKFNMQNPFSIFLHATSNQSVFAKTDRLLSHGCVRLEKPFELASALLRGAIDIEKLKGGKKDTESKILNLPSKVPVFIIYMPVAIEGGKVSFLKDEYKLIK
jgi:murein L,D-transpeptidase YcbB/YkuD